MQPDSEAAFLDGIAADEGERARFATFDRLLLETAAHTNLVARSSIPARWQRHYADSAQLLPCIPAAAGTLLDIGSGAGFPGIVLAILATARRPALRITLCDSVGKKASFLRKAVDGLELANAEVIEGRIEALAPARRFDAITARAVTALPDLLALAAPRLAAGGLMVFPKGRRAQEEVDAARERWSFDVEQVPSGTDPSARILLIRAPKRTA